MAQEAKKLIERLGCQALVAPALREVGLGEKPEVLAFGERLLTHDFSVIVFLTGVGAKALFSLLEVRYPREKIIHALRAAVVVARGPKTVRALREFGVTANLSAPEPNTWREILSVLDSEIELKGRKVAVQEYGASSPELLAELRARGAQVFPVPVYRWALPEDCGPLRAAIDSIVAGQQDIVLFTSATQVANVCQLAQEEGKLTRLLAAFGSVLVGSIGPTCSEALRARGITVGFEPSIGRLSHLVKDAATRGAELLRLKRAGSANHQ